MDKRYLLLTLKGIAMGAADVVPGVSGGTIAFITGLYDELLGSIKKIDATAIKLFFTGKFKQFMQYINGYFLLSVLLGIAISIFSLAKLMTWLLTNHPIQIWSFFFGLIIASSILVATTVKEWNWKTILSSIIGATVAYYITVASPTTTPDSYWFIFLSGAIAICAMILPGISGSFILLLLGKYSFIMDSISQFKIDIMAVFAVGAAIGIISFSHFLSWLLKKYNNLTIALLTGFMVGSLNKVWPWKETLESYIDSHGVEQAITQRSILPTTFEQLTGQEAHIVEAIIYCIIGLVLVSSIEFIAKKLQK